MCTCAKSSVSASGDFRALARERSAFALVCHACSAGDKGVCQLAAVTVEGVAAGHGPRGVCPRRKFGAGDEIVRWPTFGGRCRGIAWYGSPMPLRWWWRLKTGIRLERQAGCGCVVALKDAWVRHRGPGSRHRGPGTGHRVQGTDHRPRLPSPDARSPVPGPSERQQ